MTRDDLRAMLERQKVETGAEDVDVDALLSSVD